MGKKLKNAKNKKGGQTGPEMRESTDDLIRRISGDYGPAAPASRDYPMTGGLGPHSAAVRQNGATVPEGQIVAAEVTKGKAPQGGKTDKR